MREWRAIAEENGISYQTFRARIDRFGWGVEKAATEPVHKRRAGVKWLKLAIDNGIKKDTYNARLRAGWNPEVAATKPSRNKKCHKKYLETARVHGVKESTYRDRVRRGWSREEAATVTNQNPRRKDASWIEKANKNGISYEAYRYRVDEMFWTPKEAATTPTLTSKEAALKASNAATEYRKIMHDRVFNDPTNMFLLTPQHFKVAKQNGIKRNTLISRVNNYGWTVQEAITKPALENTYVKLDGYLDYLHVAIKNGIKRGTYEARVRRGWTLEKASTKEPSLSNPTRSDRKWIELAAKNGIIRETYDQRLKRGWTPEEAATTPILKNGEFLNEETRRRAVEGFKEFRKR